MIVDIEVPFKKPQLVVNSFFNPDSTWSATVSLNRHILSDVSFIHIENALVIMYQNDFPIDTLEHQQNGFYKSKASKPIIETDYKIRVSAQNMTAVSGASQIPSPAQISKVEIDNSTTSPFGSSRSIINITFSDNAKEINYYQVMVEMEREWYNQNTGKITKQRTPVTLESNDLITMNDNINWDGGMVIKDVLFNGKQVTLSFVTQYLGDDGTLLVSLQTLSEDCYQYKATADLQNKTSGDPFAQPVNVSSNIENGFGVFAGYSQSIFTRVSRKPIISGINPAKGKIGDHVIVSGENLQGGSVTFASNEHNVYGQTVRSSENEIEVIVPERAITGKIVVYTSGGAFMSYFDFEVVN